MAWVLRMPEVAANAGEAVLSAWTVAEATSFAAEDTIATIETEKAVVDVPADADGVLLKTLVQAGATVPVGAPIAVLGDAGDRLEDLDRLLAQLDLDGAGDPINGISSPAIPVAAVGARIFSSPLARRLASDAGLSLTALTGTGPGGRVVRRDVERAVEAGGAVQPAAGSMTPADAATAYVDIPHTRMRRAIATRLTESTRDAPHFFLHGSASVDKLLRLRARLNEQGTVQISVNDLLVAAAARAHQRVPSMNVIWTPDAVRQFSGVDIALAVATEKGLVAPVLRGIDRMTVSAVATASRDLVSRARAGRLRADELVGGTLTVSNLGAFGTPAFAAIINPPQSAVLAVGAARQEPVVRKGKLRVGTVMHVTLSVDHRPIDGAVAAQWMAAFVSLLETPVLILA
jgi:pyruvate dehydrogenase E2 component (dihydrolipoamide acetyltransferase)